jgi:hypothetical protein
VAQQHTGVAGPQRTGRFHIALVPHHRHGSPKETGIACPRHRHQRQQQAVFSRPQHRHQRQCQAEFGQRQHDIQQQGNRFIHEPPGISGDAPHEHTHTDRYEQNQHRHSQRHLPAIQDTGKLVTAKQVGAERVRPGWPA